MNIDLLKSLRETALISLFSDDNLSELFIVKGGTALDLLHKLDDRASVDIDVSTTDDFDKEKFEVLLENELQRNFNQKNYTVFDFKVLEKPKSLDENLKGFWGGYDVQFKIIESENAKLIDNDINRARQLALEMLDKTKRMSIDISKHEYCDEDGMVQITLEGFQISTYTLKMILLEKLRAICQQLPGYFKNKGKYRKPRAKDFYDINLILEYENMNFTKEDRLLLEKIFAAKKVSLELLKQIPLHKDFFEKGSIELKDTISNKKRDKLNFDTYYDSVINVIKELGLD